MKKAIKYLFASIAMIAVASLLLTSCNTKEEKTYIYTYVADGQVSASDDPSSAMAIPIFNEEIEELLGGASYSLTEKDDEVIAACDALYETLKPEHPKWKGEVKILKYISDAGTDAESIKGTTIKTYSF